jgi:hypothetical protein
VPGDYQLELLDYFERDPEIEWVGNANELGAVSMMEREGAEKRCGAERRARDVPRRACLAPVTRLHPVSFGSSPIGLVRPITPLSLARFPRAVLG